MSHRCGGPRGRFSLQLVSLAVLLALLTAGEAGGITDFELEEVRSVARSGRTYEALAQLAPILEADPQDRDALLLKGALLAELGRVDEAKTIFLTLIESNPELPEPYVNLAALYGAAGDYDRAIQVLKQALETHPSYQAAYESLNKVYGKLASRAYQHALGEEELPEETPVELALLDRIHSSSTRGLESAEPVSFDSPEQVADTSGGPLTDQVPAQDDSSLAMTLGEPTESPEAPGEQVVAIHVNEEKEVLEGMGAAAHAPANLKEPAVSSAELATGSNLEGISELIKAWAVAWSDQKTEEYLGYYSASFVPTGDLDREDWEILRRARLGDPDYISVSLENLEVSESGSGVATARFVQSYESNVLSDVCVKVLDLVWEEESWRIARERIEE